jgi:hypothetical protein
LTRPKAAPTRRADGASPPLEDLLTRVPLFAAVEFLRIVAPYRVFDLPSPLTAALEPSPTCLLRPWSGS